MEGESSLIRNIHFFSLFFGEREKREAGEMSFQNASYFFIFIGFSFSGG